VITGWILHLLADVASGFLGILPHIDVPSWLSGSGSYASTVFQAAGSMSVWFPAPLVLTIVLAVGVLWFAAFGVKLARIFVSHFTGGGGSAA
jgi:hypothetical protein